MVASRIRVLLVDDNDEFLARISAWLDGWPWLEVVGQVGSGEAAIFEANRLAPDLVLTDLCMPGMNGIEVARRLKRKPDGPRVIVVTFYASASLRSEAIAAGADGLLDKADVTECLMPSIRSMFPNDDTHERSFRARTVRPNSEKGLMGDVS